MFESICDVIYCIFSADRASPAVSKCCDHVTTEGKPLQLSDLKEVHSYLLSFC